METERMCAQEDAGIHHDEGNYELFLQSIREGFAQHAGPFFTTNAEGLWPAFLNALPPELRQHYTCNACRHFVERFGGIVAITQDGKTVPVMWPDDVPGLYHAPTQAAKKIVLKARVTGVFLSKDAVWGQPVTGPWHHMAVIPPNDLIFKNRVNTPFQAMAEKKEDMKTLISGLIEFPVSAVEQAIKLLKTDSLYRSEKCLGVAEWLKAIHDVRNNTKNSGMRSNLIWLAVATAPPGFCHVKSTMIGALLEDIVAGIPFNTISKRFADKMHSLRYQRPQAPPSSGNIDQAEKIIEQMGVARSLARRFVRIEDLKLLWSPTADKEAEEPIVGIFSHLKPKERAEVKPVTIPPIAITWEKFSRSVLPTATQIEMLIPSEPTSFSALVTASCPDAPPILQWDLEDERNPVSWYLYTYGSQASQWNLTPSSYCPVTGICLRPSMWGKKPMSNQREGLFIILQGAKDIRNTGLCLFPEHLRHEYHAIRATIEAYSRSRNLEGQEEASACGIGLSKGQEWNVILRTTSPLGTVDYKLDRWD